MANDDERGEGVKHAKNMMPSYYVNDLLLACPIRSQNRKKNNISLSRKETFS